jgi:hypothetical protein
MNIYKTINAELNKSAYTIKISNIDASSNHWGMEKQIYDGLSSIEPYLYDKESFNKNMVLFALKAAKANNRIEDVKFYRIPDENKIILLAITDVRKMKDVELFKREMNITFKKDNFSFSIIELLKKELEDLQANNQSFPSNWQIDQYLTDRFLKLRDYV